MRKLLGACTLISLLVFISCKENTTSVVSADTGVIQGIVQDYNGIAQAGIPITISPAVGTSLTTNEAGQYRLEGVPIGTYTITATKPGGDFGSVSVSVIGGKTTYADILIFSEAANGAPTISNNLFPTDSSLVSVGNAVLFSWKASDPENDILVYDVYCGTNPTLSQTDKISTEQLSSYLRYFVPGADTGKSYYWQVVAKDVQGNETKGPVTRFHFASIGEGLIVWLPFDHSTTDQSNLKNSTGAYNIQYTTNRHGSGESAIALTGLTSSNVQVNHNEVFNFTQNQDVSISCWLQFSGTQPDFAGIVCKARPEFSGGFKGWQLTIRDGSRLGVQYGDASAFTNETLTNVTVNDGKWHHVVVVVNRSDRNLKMYVDNRLVREANSSIYSMNVNNDDPLRIGIERNSSRAFKGNIDDVRVFNRALGSKDVALLFSE